MIGGWLKLHRSIQEWEWGSESSVLTLFIHLLIRANIKPARWKGEDLLEGELIFTRKAYCEHTGLSDQQIRTIMKKLEKSGTISIRPTNKYSIVSINNWDKYQSPMSENDKGDIKKTVNINQQISNNQPPDNQHKTIIQSTNNHSRRIEEEQEEIKEINKIEMDRTKNSNPISNDSISILSDNNSKTSMPLVPFKIALNTNRQLMEVILNSEGKKDFVGPDPKYNYDPFSDLNSFFHFVEKEKLKKDVLSIVDEAAEKLKNGSNKRYGFYHLFNELKKKYLKEYPKNLFEPYPKKQKDASC